MKESKYIKTMLLYVIKNQKTKFIFKYGILIGGIIPILIVGSFIDIVFNNMLDNFNLFIINMGIKLILSSIIGYIVGNIKWSFYCSIINEYISLDALKWKYIISDGVLGWGMICELVTTQMYPLDMIDFIFILIWLIGGLGFGSIMWACFEPKYVRGLGQKLLNEEL